ncbi:hypothetical protein HU200_043993 [Digitaria exilis]|uniref:Uncharacterized protein n=1 Tax=Digitaria exilis TaxID=1010633 RepID=A0A835BDF3_9POAL|nr:hypothetical protein HU200_043993 [Digitaria exilis]
MFTGNFPSSTWKLMENLVALNASNNSFSGQVPSSFCLASASFAVLDLQFNKFSGNIPSALGNCSMLKVLMLGHNNLSSTIPDELFNSSTSLERLSFRNAGLRGTLDSAHVTKLTDLVALDLGENSFTSKIPESIGQLKRLEELLLDNNKMSGELPPGVQILFVGKNFMDEAMPQDKTIDGFENLQALGIDHCLLTGKMPTWLSKLKNLEVLDLSSNLLTGKIPAALNNLHFLSKFNISNNDLEGPVPTGGQLSTFPDSSFDGNPKLCGSMLTHPCNSIEEAPRPIMTTRDCSEKIIFAVSFALSFGLAVLYDQIHMRPPPAAEPPSCRVHFALTN